MRQIRVFIVDDHYMVIEGIRSLLQHQESLELIGHASNASSCLSFLSLNKPDVILMDINLPDKSGIDLCQEVHQLYPDIRILGLSTFNQHSFIHKMMEKGASGYLLKNATQQELTEAINTVFKGHKYLSLEAATTIRTATDKSSDIPLITRREKEILELIADGMTNPEIAEKLFVSVSTVDTHRKNLLSKFNVKNTAALVKFAAHHKLI
jgi:DNA-binding NarL/FixJ family response regulator